MSTSARSRTGAFASKPTDRPVIAVLASSKAVAAPGTWLTGASFIAATLTEVDGDHFTLIDTSTAAWTKTLQILDTL